jgi:hypothetical protein
MWIRIHVLNESDSRQSSSDMNQNSCIKWIWFASDHLDSDVRILIQMLASWFRCSHLGSDVPILVQMFPSRFRCSHLDSDVRILIQMFPSWFRCSHLDSDVRILIQMFPSWFRCSPFLSSNFYCLCCSIVCALEINVFREQTKILSWAAMV